ncbi:GNAT family N-acetyltransferase, partial [Teichococcus deserti]|uniref:GNAT family N-acetyltransferase n=1 Tax=Teichococcus deserti TaxID=1817963 RepID=UPI0013F67385
METRVVTLRERPELGPQVAAWLWHAFWRENGESLETVLAVVGQSNAERGPQQSFVLLEDGAPAGTASLAAADLDERPELTPWLAGVYVRPESRRRGYGARLV